MTDLKTFRETIRPTLYTNMFLGIGIFEFSNKTRVKPFAEKIYACCCLVMMELCYYMTVTTSMYFKLPLQAAGSKMVILRPMMWYTVMYQSACLIVIMARRKPEFSIAQVFRKVIHLIEENDRRMEAIGLSRDYRSPIVHVASITGPITAALRENRQLLQPPYRLDNMSNHELHVLLLDQRNCTIGNRYVWLKFDQLNHLLMKMIEALDPPKQKRFLETTDDLEVKRSEDNDDALLFDTDTVKKIKKSHLALIRIAKQISAFYGVQILLTSTIILVRLVILFYVCNKMMWYPPPDDQLLPQILDLMLFSLINLSMVYMVHHICTKTSYKAAETGDLLCRLYNSSTTIEFRDEIRRFTTQVLQNPLLFSICGLVDLDGSFILNALGNMFGYMIMLIQMETQRLRTRMQKNSTEV
ncbi:uncharacterized protein LOC116428957 [Nomia melanderi]|uniref:uncharacterized protein LOC116428957 n=1 Tax=Nomia melanderi TaxID=2448451 RepID=UPI003FCDAF6A